MAAKKVKDLKHDHTHVALIRYKGRRMFSVFLTVVLTGVFSGWIWVGLRSHDMAWYSIALPMVFIGLLTLVLQPEEEWTYTPWQESTQKYEKNIYD